MLKETESEETLVIFVTLLSLAAIQLGENGPPHGYVYVKETVI